MNFPKPAIKSAYGLFCSEQRGEKGEKKSGVGDARWIDFGSFRGFRGLEFTCFTWLQ